MLSQKSGSWDLSIDMVLTTCFILMISLILMYKVLDFIMAFFFNKLCSCLISVSVITTQAESTRDRKGLIQVTVHCRIEVIEERA